MSIQSGVHFMVLMSFATMFIVMQARAEICETKVQCN
jgi:hypothetical protein